MEGWLRIHDTRDYFVLWRTELYQWKSQPETKKLSTAEKVYDLSKLQNLETDPSQRHVLILKLPSGRIELAASNPGSYQAWLSCFAVFHVRNSLERKAPYLVPSAIVKAIWAVLDDVHWRGCQTANIFRTAGNVQSTDMLRLQLLKKGPGTVDPSDHRKKTVAAVAKVLLDSLPESLWTEFAMSYLAKANDENSLREVIQSLPELREVIQSLPEQNSELLKKLFITLSSVASNEAKSKMSVEDLARVITPALDSREDPVGPDLEKITRLCISEYQTLFIGAPLLIVVVPKIEDILTYKRVDSSNKKKKKRHDERRQPRGGYREERLPRHAETIDRSSGSSNNLCPSSDDESSDSQSRQSQKRLNFLRPQFSNDHSPRLGPTKNQERGGNRSRSLFLADLPEIGPISDGRRKSALNISLIPDIVEDEYDEKLNIDDDSFDMFGDSMHLLVPTQDDWKNSDRARSMSVVLQQSVADSPNTEDVYSALNVRKVVGKRRAANTRQVKSLVTDSFFIYGYLNDEDRSLTLDGLFPTRSSRLSIRHRIKLPIAEDQEYDEYQKDLMEQKRNSELLEVFGSNVSASTLSPSLNKKN